MSDTFAQMQAMSSGVQRHLDTITNLLHLAALLQDKNQLQIVQGILQKESDALTQDSQKLAELMDQFKEEKRMFRFPKVPAMLVIILLLALFGVVSAQDVPLVTNTPVAASINGNLVEATLEPTIAVNATVAPPTTGEPTTIVIQEPTNANTNQVVGYLFILLVTGLIAFISTRQVSTLADVAATAMKNQQVQAEAHRLYAESSLSVQNIVTLVGGLAKFVGGQIPGDDLVEKAGTFIDAIKADPPATPPATTDTPGVFG